MINSTNTVNIDGVAFRQFNIKDAFSAKDSDNFTRWVVRPLALLVAIGIGVAAFLASAVLILTPLPLLPLLPLLAVAMWAMKTKVERELTAADAPTDGETAARERRQVVG